MSRAPIRDRRLPALRKGEKLGQLEVSRLFLVPRIVTPCRYVLAHAGCDHIRVNTVVAAGVTQTSRPRPGNRKALIVARLSTSSIPPRNVGEPTTPWYAFRKEMSRSLHQGL